MAASRAQGPKEEVVSIRGVLAPVLLSIFINDTVTAIECILSKSADDTELVSALREGMPSRGTMTSLRRGQT